MQKLLISRARADRLRNLAHARDAHAQNFPRALPIISSDYILPQEHQQPCQELYQSELADKYKHLEQNYENLKVEFAKIVVEVAILRKELEILCESKDKTDESYFKSLSPIEVCRVNIFGNTVKPLITDSNRRQCTNSLPPLFAPQQRTTLNRGHHELQLFSLHSLVTQCGNTGHTHFLLYARYNLLLMT